MVVGFQLYRMGIVSAKTKMQIGWSQHSTSAYYKYVPMDLGARIRNQIALSQLDAHMYILHKLWRGSCD